MLALEFRNDRGGADLVYQGGRLLSSGRDLETAIIVSLFVDAPALPGDALPPGTPRRGYWADSIEGVASGSRLWLLEGAEATPASAARAEGYCQEALKWLLDQRLVRAIDTESEVHGDAIYVGINVTQRDGTALNLGPFRVGGRA